MQSPETKVGVLVVLGTILFVGLALLLSKHPFWKDGYPVYVSFPFVEGIKNKTPVMMAGLRLGKYRHWR